MFTKKEIAKSIHEVKDWPMTPENVLTFASLLYIKEHMSADRMDADQSAADEVEDGLTPEMAEQWVRNMKNVDGTCGHHWSMDATEKVRKECNVTENPLEWWVTMNMMYSDYCKVAEKLGVNTLEFYACMAKAFLQDPDAKPGKLARYYECIADA